MPIPQVEKKKSHVPEHIRDASSIRKKRAHGRSARTERRTEEKKERSSFFGSRKRKKQHSDEAEQKKKRVLSDRTNPDAEKDGKKNGGKGKGDKTKGKKSRWRKALKIFVIFGIFCIGIGLIGVAAAYAWVSKDLADITDLESRAVDETTKIYDRSGTVLLYEVGDNKHIQADFENINPHVWEALLSLEDKRFYEHNGIDPIGIARAVFHLRDLQTAQGASTLTQQFVSNAILNKDRTLERKAKELILAIRLEQKYTKDEILEFYLNEVYFGNNQQGVEAAAQDYFGKSAKDVTLAEAATLASIPKNPPKMLANPERLDERRDYALKVMVEEGYISKEEAEAAQQEEITLNESVSEIKAPHFVFYVREYLEEKYGQNTVRRGGLKVITTLDWDKQQMAESVINDHIGTVEEYGGSNAALVAMDAHSGQVLAMVGSRDYFDAEKDGQVNVATSLRQPGSSIKPVAYLAAFEKGYTPDTKVYDVETDFPSQDGGETYHPRNYSLNTHGPVTLRYALSQSLNIPAVKVLYLVGVQEFIDFAQKMGYTSFTERDRYGLSMVLGGAEVTLLEHTATYATFAREGQHHAPATVMSVEDNAGAKLEEWQDVSEQVVDAGAARTLNSVLSDNTARGYTFSGLNLSDRPGAAKTGTTNDFRDAWAMGYTPSLAVGVWTGNNDNTSMNEGADGIYVAAPIWKDFMERALAGTPVEQFQPADYHAATPALAGNTESQVEKTVDKFSGDVIPDECLSTYPSEYTEKRMVNEPHTILYYIDRTNPTGPAPSDPSKDPMYNSWETAVRAWAGLKNDVDETPEDGSEDSTSSGSADCSITSDNQDLSMGLLSPNSGGIYSSSSGVTLSVSAAPGIGRSITSAQFLIDGFVVDSKTGLQLSGQQTITSGYRGENLTSGQHEATVRITDDRGHTAQDSASFEFKNSSSNSDKKEEGDTKKN